MKPKTAQECREWHQNLIVQNYCYNFKDELIKYCANDVKILTMSIMKFRELFRSVTELDPISRCFTLASVGLEFFRARILKENTIGINPINGYSGGRHRSIMGNIWLDYQQTKHNYKIIREQRLGSYWADGFIAEDNHVFEFFGCRYHGCIDCFRNGRDIPIPDAGNRTYDELLNKTNMKVIK